MIQQRKIQRIRSRISGTPKKPRLSATITNRHVVAQVIDDTSGKTLAYSSSVDQKVDGNLRAKAEWVGSDIAKRAKKAKISTVVFDRRGRQYHGRVRAFAEAARKEGLEF